MIGSKIGPYEIVSALGAGGMGEVYRARDSKLDRDVALKVLPETLAADLERLRRFEREAKTLAALNHPHIAQIYGLVDVGGRHALVMEFVPGRTLDAVIRSHHDRSGGGIPVSEAVPIALQIAEALETAHEAGIVHRDLKPANVMIRDDETVKVLDFGLARSADSAIASAAATASSPTILPSAMTAAGVILGTAGYMSPEQAKGRTADKRSDIWAFGVVLYEMLTGRPLFGGETATEVIAAVIKDTPNLDALPTSTPIVLRRLLERCLERDPRLRLRDIGEARIALTRIDSTAGANALDESPSARAPRSRVRSVGYAIGVLAIAAAAAIVGWISKPSGAPVPPRRFELPRPIAEAQIAAISPDGGRIAYVYSNHLYVHGLDTGTASDLGPTGATVGDVFWSPDGRTIGINVDSSLRSIPASGGAFFTICKVPASGLVTKAVWQPDESILFAVWRDSLYRVPASGGTPDLHTAIDPASEVDFHTIAPLPGDRLAVSTHIRGKEGMRLDVIDGGRRAAVANGEDINAVRFQPPDKLLYLRVRTNPGVWAATLTGSIDIAHAALLEPGAIAFDAAVEGSLIAAYMPKDRRELIWVTRQGAATAVPGLAFETSNGAVALSPDGRRAVLSVRGPGTTQYFVIRDLATGADTRVPSPLPATIMTNGESVSWTPGQRLLYGAGGVESWRIYNWPSDGSPGAGALAEGVNAKMTADGAEVFYLRDERGVYRLYHAAVQADGSFGPATPVLAEADTSRVRSFDVSPDGRLLVFTTDNSDTQQLNVIVTTLQGSRERRQLTSSGSGSPLFSRDGRQLYFLSGQRDNAGRTHASLDVAAVASSPFTVGNPETLFVVGENGGSSISGFDIAADGRLLMTRKAAPQPGDEARIVLRQNWMAALPK